MTDEALLWKPDRAGVQHFQGVHPLGPKVADGVMRASVLALRTRPAGPCWFWWAGSPAPMTADDTAETLLHRWREWRAAGVGSDTLWRWSMGFL